MKTLVRLLSTVAFVGACASPVLAADGADIGDTRADLGGLIGHRVEAARDAQTIGKVDAILATRDGRISTVIMNNRGREVALAWTQLRFSDHGKKVSVEMTRDQVNALPDYKYQETPLGDSVLTMAPQRVVSHKVTKASSAMNNAPAPTKRLPAGTKTATSTSPAPAPSSSNMKTAASTPAATNPADHHFADAATGLLVGHNVENAAGQQIGEVDNVAIDSHGKVSSVIVGVGGFLGVGKRDVALNWSSLRISDDADKVAVDMTKDQIKALPAVQSKVETTPSGKRLVVGSLGL